MDTEEGVDDEENPDFRRGAYGKKGEDELPLVTSATKNTEELQTPDLRHSNWATERATAATAKKAGLQLFQTALRQKLTPKVWTSAGALDQWLSGRNKRTPCRKLASLDPVKIREWIGPEQLTSFMKNCAFHLETGRERHRILTTGP